MTNRQGEQLGRDIWIKRLFILKGTLSKKLESPERGASRKDLILTKCTLQFIKMKPILQFLINWQGSSE
jgi:hypothetical protein